MQDYIIFMPFSGTANWSGVKEITLRGLVPTRRLNSERDGHCFTWVGAPLYEELQLSLFMGTVSTLASLLWWKMAAGSRLGESCCHSLDFKLAEPTKWNKSSARKTWIKEMCVVRRAFSGMCFVLSFQTWGRHLLPLFQTHKVHVRNYFNLLASMHC